MFLTFENWRFGYRMEISLCHDSKVPIVISNYLLKIQGKYFVDKNSISGRLVPTFLRATLLG